MDGCEGHPIRSETTFLQSYPYLRVDNLSESTRRQEALSSHRVSLPYRSLSLFLVFLIFLTLSFWLLRTCTSLVETGCYGWMDDGAVRIQARSVFVCEPKGFSGSERSWQAVFNIAQVHRASSWTSRERGVGTLVLRFSSKKSYCNCKKKYRYSTLY
jgi:hypothetical protein